MYIIVWRVFIYNCSTDKYGDGVTMDYKKAVERYTKAAEQGHQFAIDALEALS